MTKLTINPPVTGEKDTVAEPKVGTAFTAIETWANGNIDSAINIKANSITEASIASGKALVVTGNSYVNKTYTKAEVEAGIEPSATRMAFVAIQFSVKEVGGVVLAGAPQEFLVPPGQKWKMTTVEANVNTSTLLL